MKKLIAAVAALALGTSMISMPVSAAGIRLTDDVIDLKTDEEYPTSGYCGAGYYIENISWSFDETTGTLTFSGAWGMMDWSKYDRVRAPWYGYDIKKVIIGDGITSIGESAFEDCANLTSVEIPDSVTSIYDSAFSGCSSLTSITIPKGVDYIHEYTFEGCSKLSSIEVPYGTTTIGDNAFYECTSLSFIEIPDTVKRIGSSAFLECSSLTSIEIPDSVIEIEDWAFCRCTGFTSITIPDGVTKLDDSVFSDCNNLAQISLPDNLTEIGEFAFYNCTSLTSFTIPESVTRIEDAAFEDCDGLTSIKVPDSTTYIGDYIFCGCVNLTSVDIPNSITKIPKSAFARCYNLSSFEIPDSITYIGNYAFLSCNSLNSVTIPNSVTNIGEGAFSGTPWLNKQLRTSPFVTVNNIVIASNTNTCVGDIIIPDDIKIIGGGAFYNCKYMTSITIPDNVTCIGESAFENCTGLTSIIIPKNVTSIDELAFSNCSGLSTITIPNSTTYIGDYAFSCCSGLTSVSISDKVTYIGEYAFSKCNGLTSIIIPTSVTEIGSGAFYNCGSLESVTIENPYCRIKGDSETFSNGYDENSNFYFNGTIYGYKSSSAQDYADEQGYTFVGSLGTAPSIGSQPDGSFIFGDGNELSADEVENSEVKPQLSVSNVEIPENEAGNTEVEISVNVSGADNKWCNSGIHLNYHDGLTLLGYGKDGAASKNLEMKDSKIYDGGVFYTSASTSDSGGDGVIVTYFFKLPENAKAGDIYPIYIAYAAGDYFTNSENDKAMTAYAFAHAQSGSITVVDSEVQTTTTTITTTAEITTTTVKDTTEPAPETTAETATETSPAATTSNENVTDVSSETTESTPVTEPVNTTDTTDATTKTPVTMTTVPSTTTPEQTVQDLGDVDRSGNIDSSDASIVLQEYALLATGHSGDLTPEQTSSADVNSDGSVDSSDASTILQYYAYTATGGKDTFDVFLKKESHPRIGNYEIIPMMEPFQDFFFVKTDNLDPDSFRFVDKESIYTDETDTIESADTKYADVNYENEKNLRVNGGYLFRSTLGTTDGGKVSLQLYDNEKKEWEDTEMMYELPKLCDEVDYLIQNFANKPDFFENMDAVQSGFSDICLYSGSYVRGEIQRVSTYWNLQNSPHNDQSFYVVSPYSRTDNQTLLASSLYPFRYDSIGFPSILGKVALRLDNSATYKWDDYYHYEINVTYNGETHTYGGAGSGEGQGIDKSDIRPFTLNDEKITFTLNEIRNLLDTYAKLDVPSDIPHEDDLTLENICNTVGENGAWVSLVGVASIFGGTYNGYAYLYKGDNDYYFSTDELSTGGCLYWGGSLDYASDAWVDSRYVNENEVFEPYEKFEDHPTSDIILTKTTYPVIDYDFDYVFDGTTGEYHKEYTSVNIVEKEGLLRFSYNADENTWEADEYAVAKELVDNGMLDENNAEALRLTYDEVMEMEIDANNDKWPSSGYIYDGSAAPGTPFQTEDVMIETTVSTVKPLDVAEILITEKLIPVVLTDSPAYTNLSEFLKFENSTLPQTSTGKERSTSVTKERSHYICRDNEYALLTTGHSGDLTPEQTSSADVNSDGSVDSSDASTILRYYAYTATGGKDPFDVFLKN